MEKRGQRRALPPKLNISGTKIPYDGHLQCLSQFGAVPGLMRAPRFGIMSQCLAMKTSQLCALKACHQLDMRLLYQRGSL